MSALWTIFIFVLILSFVTFIHEIGHFATAKWRGVKVLEFGMGFPPRIWGFRRGETEYSLNAIPFGGFTKMLGEEDPSEPRSLASKGVSTRILILSAGSLMMFLFPVILFTIVYMVPHDVVVGGEGIRIVQVVTDTPAHTARIEPDDEILSIIQRYLRGIAVDDETLALDLIHETGAGGGFIDTDHTLNHFRDELLVPDLVRYQSRDAWEAAGRPDMVTRAREKARRILAEHTPRPLPGDVVTQLDEIVRETTAIPA